MNRLHNSFIIAAVLVGTFLAHFTTFTEADAGNVRAHYQAPVPAFGVSVTLPADVTARWVFGAWQIAPSAIAAGELRLSVGCDGVVNQGRVPANGGVHIQTYSAVITSQCATYQFINNADPAGTNAVLTHSWVDFLNESFESRASANATWERRTHANATWERQTHANATWERQTYANATWESQVHANATWCPLTGAGCFVPISDAQGNFSGNFTGNFSGNVTGNQTGTFSGNFTCFACTGNQSGSFVGNFTGNFNGSLNQSFNVTDDGDMSEVNVSTAFDSWIPVLILGGAVLAFGLARMFFPAVAAIISLAANLFDPPVFGVAGAVIIISTALILQILSNAFTDR